MSDVAQAAGYASLEARYLDRARAAVAGREVERVLADRSPPSHGGAALAGWWVAADAPAPLVVLPNPWDDRDAVAEAEAYVWSLVGVTVERIAAAVEPRRTPEAWHLLLAPWLVHAGSALVDRLLYLRAAAEVAPGVPVLAADALDPPATMAESVELLRTDAGNRALLGALAGVVGVSAVPASPAQPPAVGTSGRGPADPRALARAGATALETALLSLARRAPTTLVGMDPLRPGDGLRLAAHAGGLWLAPPWRRPRALSPPPADPAARDALAFAPTGGATPQDALWSLLPRLLPRSVLEGRDELAAEARRRYGAPRHAIVNNYGAEDVQNAFLADCVEAGRRLTFAQHGGFYLQARVNAQERLERRPGATFLSWGATGDGILVAPSPRLATLRDKHRGGGRIVLIEGIQPPDTFLIRFGSHPLANQALAQDRQLIELVRAVAPATRDRFVLKRFPSHLPGTIRAPELAALPHRGPVRSGRAVDWMAHAALAVVTYPDTPFIEAMLLGVPTIGLWPAGLWELRDDAREPFERLAGAGVVFDDPAAAAARLDEVAGDAAAWWQGTEVQAARHAFLARFAAIPRRPLAPWVAHLRELRRAA